MVVFKRKKEGYKIQSVDAFIDGKMWEFKAPNGGKLSTIEKNLRRAKLQSKYVVFDSIRTKGIPDYAIKREILPKAPLISDMFSLIVPVLLIAMAHMW